MNNQFGGHEAVLDIGQHRVHPAEGRVARRPAIGAGDVALMDDAPLFGDAAKPLAAIADDGGSGLDGRARAWLASACAEAARQRWSRSQAAGPARC